MILIVKNFFILSFIITIALTQIGCDTFSDFFENFSKKQDVEDVEPLLPSYEKTLLLDILENQKELIEEMQYARDNGDNRLIKELYEAILRIDQSYQEEFEKYEGELSHSDGIEISKKHHEIIRSIPSYSSMMQ